MGEIFIVVGLIVLAGIGPLLLVIFLAMRALKKTFDQIEEHIDTFNFNKLPDDKLFLTSFPYYTDSEIHGYNINVMTKMCNGIKPEYVCRATIFGGTKHSINTFNMHFFNYIYESLNNDVIGTEESIYTIISINHPELIHRYEMPYGDIKNYLNTIRSR